MNLLFLDIDGVLNSARFLIATGLHSYPTPNPSDCILDEVAVKLLKKTSEICGLDLFIHSSWWSQERINDEYLGRVFTKYGWNDPHIIGGCSDYEREKRVEIGIKNYNPDKYIILDDSNLEAQFPGNMCLVDSYEGFGYRNHCQILEHFDKHNEIKVCLL